MSKQPERALNQFDLLEKTDYVRMRALEQALSHYTPGVDPAVVVVAAEAFYNFLSADFTTITVHVTGSRERAVGLVKRQIEHQPEPARVGKARKATSVPVEPSSTDEPCEPSMGYPSVSTEDVLSDA